jgi:isopentenyl-diphosphate delta-isomerase
MSRSINDRKVEHLQIVNSDAAVDRKRNHFDLIHLTHRALPELALADVDPAVDFLGKRLSFPLLISSMTGGDHELIRTINTNLAIAAEATGVALAVGSQRVMFENPAARKSFELREFAPKTLLLANLGAAQLNYGFMLEHCEEALAVLAGDGLVLHLNPLQEAIQPEGTTDFGGLAAKIGKLAGELKKPIILKEVGCGISPADVNLLVKYGISHIDVAGSGGTSWSRIEHQRQTDGASSELGLKFQDWGIPTPVALELLAPMCDRVSLIASGGLRSGIDMVKAIVLGASLCGVAAPFLRPAMTSAADVIREIEEIKREFLTAMFLLGAKDVSQIFRNRSLLLEY